MSGTRADGSRVGLASRHAVALAYEQAAAIEERWSDLRHEAHAALLGIEAAVVGLTRHRHLLMRHQAQHLSDALVSEVHRLHALLDSDLHAPSEEEPTTVGLLDAIQPVVECMRAGGLDVTVNIPRRLNVEGIPGHTTRVVQSLLNNVREHAPGAHVEISVVVQDEHVGVVVEDTGPGIPQHLRRSIFGRGVRGPSSEGSGLGLFIARQLMDAQDGSIWIEPRSQGGTAVVLRYRRPPEEERLHIVA